MKSTNNGYALGVQFTSEFALAFILNRPIRRFRPPLHAAVAVGLAKMFPFLATIKVSALLNGVALPILPRKDTKKPETKWTNMKNKFENIVNNYGSAYYFSSRLVGVVFNLGTYYLILNGVDISYWLNKFDINPETG